MGEGEGKGVGRTGRIFEMRVSRLRSDVDRGKQYEGGDREKIRVELGEKAEDTEDQTMDKEDVRSKDTISTFKHMDIRMNNTLLACQSSRDRWGKGHELTMRRLCLLYRHAAAPEGFPLLRRNVSKSTTLVGQLHQGYIILSSMAFL